MAQNPLLGEWSIWKARWTFSFLGLGTVLYKIYTTLRWVSTLLYILCDLVTMVFMGPPLAPSFLDVAAVSLCMLVQLLCVKMTRTSRYPHHHSHGIFLSLRK